MAITSDPDDPRLNEVDPKTGLQAAYIVDGKTDSDFVRPVRTAYLHSVCGVVTHMHISIAETYARNPHYYGATYCAGCKTHLPVGEAGDFYWDGTDEKVGT